MAFVRGKVVDGNKYYQIVHNYRENGKHRQKVIHHLGKHPTLNSAIDAERRTEYLCRCSAARIREYRELPPNSQTLDARWNLFAPLRELHSVERIGSSYVSPEYFEDLAEKHRSKLNRLLELREEYPHL